MEALQSKLKRYSIVRYLRGRRIGGEGREKWEGKGRRNERRREGEMGGEGWERMGWEKDWAYHNIHSCSEYI